MQNPFDQSSQTSVDYDSSMPICFGQPCSSHQSRQTSAICMVDIDRLSQKLSRNQTPQLQLRNSIKQLNLLVKEMKTYTESLQQRTLDIALQLEKQHMRNQQLLNALNFLRGVQQQKEQQAQTRKVQYSQLSVKYTTANNQNQLLLAQNNTLRLQNNYLKDLILMANDNYQKLGQVNKGLLQQIKALQQQKGKRQCETTSKMQQIKSMFAAIVLDKNQPLPAPNQKEKKREQLTNTGNFNTSKSIKLKEREKENTEQAYRSIFMKTLYKHKNKTSTAP